MSAAISFIATLTCSGTASALVSSSVVRYFLVTAVPCSSGCLGGRPTATARKASDGDRHLNFHETRDNLPAPS